MYIPIEVSQAKELPLLFCTNFHVRLSQFTEVLLQDFLHWVILLVGADPIGTHHQLLYVGLAPGDHHASVHLCWVQGPVGDPNESHSLLPLDNLHTHHTHSQHTVPQSKALPHTHLTGVVGSFRPVLKQRVQGLEGKVGGVLRQPHLIQHHHRHVLRGVLVLLEPLCCAEDLNDTLWGGVLAALVGEHVHLLCLCLCVWCVCVITCTKHTLELNTVHIHTYTMLPFCVPKV